MGSQMLSHYDMKFYHEAIERKKDPNDLVKKWKQTHTQFIQVFA